MYCINNILIKINEGKMKEMNLRIFNCRVKKSQKFRGAKLTW